MKGVLVCFQRERIPFAGLVEKKKNYFCKTKSVKLKNI